MLQYSEEKRKPKVTSRSLSWEAERKVVHRNQSNVAKIKIMCDESPPSRPCLHGTQTFPMPPARARFISSVSENLKTGWRNRDDKKERKRKKKNVG